MKIKNKIIEFVKKETVLSAAMVLAVLSAVMIPPDKEYIGYIDFRTLAILFCLMTVMAGLQKLGIFRSGCQPGDQQCTDSAVAVRFYRECESIDRWNESGRSGHIDRFYGKPDLL